MKLHVFTFLYNKSSKGGKECDEIETAVTCNIFKIENNHSTFAEEIFVLLSHT
jgi:hypothetical protein